MGYRISRRNFLKAAALGAGILFSNKNITSYADNLAELGNFPDAKFIGRNCSSGIMNFRVSPSSTADINKEVYEDFLFPIYREVIGENVPGTYISKWYETPYGYVFSPAVQIVKNEPNEVVSELPDSSMGKGFWAEITVPYVSLSFPDKENLKSPWYKAISERTPRAYYSQIFWINDIKQSGDGTTLYKLDELVGSYSDVVYADGRALRPLTTEDLNPIHPDVQDKRIYVDLTYQTITCYENNQEAYFCRTSSGAVYNSDGVAVDSWATPSGKHYIFRKSISYHMSGQLQSSGWDTPGVPWTTMFHEEGASIHGVFWHNSFGQPHSHGCLNCTPEDAKWIFRWTNPQVLLDPGDLTIQGNSGTMIEVGYGEG